MDSLQLAVFAAKILDSKKARNVRVLKVEDLTVMCDYFVIATGNSSTQVKALADEVEYQLGEQGVQPLRREGMDSRSWIVMDYDTVIMHVFQPETRDFYNLEHLWADAVPVEVDLIEGD